MKSLLHAVLVLTMLLAASCGRRENGPVAGGGKGALPTTRMQMGNQVFTLEIANTDSARTRGLMKRDSMPADHGMIFVFPDESPRSFWMRDTRFALDILFLDAAGKIVSVHTMKPYDLNSTSSDGAAQYAIELNAGVAAAAGVAAGQSLDIPADARQVLEH